MRQIFCGLLALISVMAAVTPLRAKTAVTLQAIERRQDLASTSMTFRFSSLPEYEVESGGQRVDLYLLGDVHPGELGPLPEDERIIKVLLAGHRKGLLASVLFRTPPARISVEKNARKKELVIDCYWNEPHGARPGLAMYVKGMPVAKGDGTAAVTGMTSRFAPDWEDLFFYRSPLDLRVPVSVHVPKQIPLPGGPWVTAVPSLWDKARAGKWNEVQEGLARESGLDGESVGFLTLLAVSRLQGGEPARVVPVANRVLTAGGGPALDALALYVKAVALARSGAFLQAGEVLRNRPDIVRREGVLAPYLRLLLAELALEAGEPEKAVGELGGQEPGSWPSALQSAVAVRRGDILTESGKGDEALTPYESVADMTLFPSSMWRRAETLFQDQAYARSAELYGRLKPLVADEKMRGLVQWREALALVEAGRLKEGVFLLKMVVQDFYATEAFDRAELALLDLQHLEKIERADSLAGLSYARVANDSLSRSLRQEAMLKQALSLRMGGHQIKSVRVLERLLHEFRSGPLWWEAEALLADILPGVVTSLIDSGERLAALVLVERNRDLLVNSKMHPEFLEKLAEGFSGLTLYTRASRVLQYLLDAGEKESREHLYARLGKLFVHLGQADRLERLVREYETGYPEGGSRALLRGLWAEALLRAGDEEGAARALPPGIAFGSLDLEAILARIHWETGDLATVAECLKDVDLAKNMQAYESELLLRAEALYAVERYEEARQVFEALAREGVFMSQAGFRLAGIHLAQGRTRQGRLLLRELSENGEAGRWAVLARELLGDLRLGALEES